MTYARTKQYLQFHSRVRQGVARLFPPGTLVVVGYVQSTIQGDMVARHIGIPDDDEWKLNALDADHLRILTPLELLALEAG